MNGNRWRWQAALARVWRHDLAVVAVWGHGSLSFTQYTGAAIYRPSVKSPKENT